MTDNNEMGRYRLGIVGDELLMSHAEVSIVVTETKIAKDMQLATGKNVRDLIAIKRTWAWSYTRLPGEKVHTADNGLTYNDLVLLFQNTNQLSLLVPDHLGNYEPVLVLISQALTGTLTRRSPWVLWESVVFGLVEV